MKKILITISIILLPALAYSYNEFKQGNEYYLKGQYQDALKEYSDFVNKNPDRYEGFYNLGNALFRSEQYDKALAAYNYALKLKPDDEDIQYNIDITKKKLEEQQKNPQNQQNSQNQQNQQGQNQQSQGQQGKQNQAQQQNGKQQNGQQQNAQQQQGKGQQAKQQKAKPNPGMSDDEIQAMLNQMKNQEKQVEGYISRQKQQQQKYNNQEMPDMFNMSPQQIMQYMENRMNGVPQKQQNDNQKNW